MIDFEFYETPAPYTRWLFRYMALQAKAPIVGRLFEPCVGNRAIIEAPALRPMEFGVQTQWVTNDLDPRWPADFHYDATQVDVWSHVETSTGQIDWTVSNTPFTPAIQIITHALEFSRVGVAMHLRASIHEVLKRGIRRTWMAQHPPTGILWLPRFAYQRSKTTSEWTTDSVTACWCVWLKAPSAAQFIAYAPESVIDELDAFTPAYRTRMDALMQQYAQAPLEMGA